MNQTDIQLSSEQESKQNLIENIDVDMLNLNMSANPFGNNTVMATAYKRAERIVLATHLVTNFIPKEETLRASVRSSSEELLAGVLSLRDGVEVSGTQKLPTLIARIRYILTLLDIAYASGYVSRMNNEVLKGAYLDLVAYLMTATKGNTSEAMTLSRENFLSVKKGAAGSPSKGQNHNGHIKDKNMSVINSRTQNDVSHAKNIGREVDVSGPTLTAFAGPSLKAKSTTAKRRTLILEYLAKVNAANATDVQNALPDLGVKMVQRELVNLVRTGAVQKEGTKRWTTYSLVY